MTTEQVQTLCEQGQRELIRTNYIEAERLLALAEHAAWEARDYDALSRLYMPLQEARRQKRQRCGEGIVRLDLVGRSLDDAIDARQIVEQYPFGQLLVAGWNSAAPAALLRRIAHERGLYLETFLSAAFPTARGPVVAILPDQGVRLPEPQTWGSVEQLRQALPRASVILPLADLPAGERRGTTDTFARVMAIWEQLHTPLLADADARHDPVQKMEGYRHVLTVDDACELAHQKLSDVARHMDAAARAGAESR